MKEEGDEEIDDEEIDDEENEHLEEVVAIGEEQKDLVVIQEHHLVDFKRIS
jgi:hypothetical protein